MDIMKEIPSGNLTLTGQEKMLFLWANCDYWPLIDAVRLLLELPPRSLSDGSEPSGEQKAAVQHLYQIALNCAGESLPLTGDDDSVEPHRVRPGDFIGWARSHMLTIFERLENILILARTANARTRAQLPEQRHAERCRTIAEYFWSIDDTLTKKEMARKTELKKYGCQGAPYKPETIENWIKEVNPNRRPGRRPHKHKPL